MLARLLTNAENGEGRSMLFGFFFVHAEIAVFCKRVQFAEGHKNGLAIFLHKPLIFLAERKGFEPSVPFGYTRFPVDFAMSQHADSWQKSIEKTAFSGTRKNNRELLSVECVCKTVCMRQSSDTSLSRRLTIQASKNGGQAYA